MRKKEKEVLKFILFFLMIIIFLFPDISNTEAQSLYLKKIADLKGMGVGYDIMIQDIYAYITGNDGFIVVDIENPYEPTKVGEFLNEYGAFGIYVKEDLAFLASVEHGLEIANISDPTEPFLIGDCNIEGISSSVYTEGNYTYLTNYETGLHIINTSDLSDPIEIGEYSVYGRADKVIVIDKTAYVAFPNHGLVVLNITTPTSPTFISTVSFTEGAAGLAFYQNLLFVGCYSSNIIILNASTPENPILLGIHSDDDEGEALGLAGNSTHLYVADNFGVEYLDISNLPTIVEKAENRDKIAAAHDVDFIDNYIFISGGSARAACIVFEVSDTQKTDFIGVPFIVVTFTLLLLIYKSNCKRKKA